MLLQHVGNAPLYLGGQRCFVDPPSELFLDQHFSQRFAARQAANMRHQDAIRAALHRLSPPMLAVMLQLPARLRRFLRLVSQRGGLIEGSRRVTTRD